MSYGEQSLKSGQKMISTWFLIRGHNEHVVDCIVVGCYNAITLLML